MTLRRFWKIYAVVVVILLLVLVVSGVLSAVFEPIIVYEPLPPVTPAVKVVQTPTP